MKAEARTAHSAAFVRLVIPPPPRGDSPDAGADRQPQLNGWFERRRILWRIPQVHDVSHVGRHPKPALVHVQPPRFQVRVTRGRGPEPYPAPGTWRPGRNAVPTPRPRSVPAA